MRESRRLLTSVPQVQSRRRRRAIRCKRVQGRGERECKWMRVQALRCAVQKRRRALADRSSSSSAAAGRRTTGDGVGRQRTYYYKDSDSMPAAKGLLAGVRVPEGLTGDGWVSWEGVAGEGMDGWVERRGSLRSGEMSQGSCKVGRGWRRSDGLGQAFADRRVSQVETGAANGRCTTGGRSVCAQLDSEQSRGRADADADALDKQTDSWAQSSRMQQRRRFRWALRKETRYAQRNGCHAGKEGHARA